MYYKCQNNFFSQNKYEYFSLGTCQYSIFTELEPEYYTVTLNKHLFYLEPGGSHSL